VTGAVGQIGAELVLELRKRYGEQYVIASDIKMPPKGSKLERTGIFSFVDVMNYDNLARVVLEYRVDWIVHLAAILSALGEQNPNLALRLNTTGVENVLEVARQNKLRVFAPSTIAVFGPNTPREQTGDDDVMRPTTMYGVTKVYLELLGEYYHKKYGVDFRSVRFPGVISSQTMPGGGTTDYAVEIYHEALKKGKYRCFLNKESEMPMMFASDSLDACIRLLECPAEKLTRRVYNVTGFSFTPAQLASSIKAQLPHFEVDYQPDFRQAIADSWPKSLNDANARQDWGWNPKVQNCDDLTSIMLKELRELYGLV